MRARRRVRRGFTLVEVIVVLAILAVAAAVSVPALRALTADEPEIETATRRFEALFKVARDSALRAGTPVTVVIDSASGRVWLTARGVAADPAEGLELELPAGVRLQLGVARARFRFTPGGGALADSVVLRTSMETRLLTLNPWSGDVVVR
jgi:general secretion pathway protein H